MPSSALTKRPSDSSSALMLPPPPLKRIKRPPKVLDEDDYTEALSQIIARDYFPGLLESKTQQEYLLALESNNPAWIVEAGDKLRQVMTPGPQTRSRQARAARNTRFNTPLPITTSRATPGATPCGFTGAETPASSVAGTEDTISTEKEQIDTSFLSLSAFQSKYTSEDNESFNALLDKQNTKRREKHIYLWTPDQRIPSARQIAYRNREAKLLKQKSDDEENGKALIPITVGAGGATERPARPDSWKIKQPNNTLMFPTSSVDEEGIETVMETRERTSRAGPKGVVHANTRLAPPPLKSEIPPPSPSLSAIRDAIAGRPRLSASEIQFSGADGDETPRVNGYAFVDEDEPENVLGQEDAAATPTYRDLLAGQVGDATPNPFKIGDVRKRESLHHRLVERTARGKRESTRQDERLPEGKVPVPRFPSSPAVMPRRGGANAGAGAGAAAAAGLTPAAKRLLDRVGRTPVGAASTLDLTGTGGTGISSSGGGGGGVGSSRLRNLWTPTPRRRAPVTPGS